MKSDVGIFHAAIVQASESLHRDDRAKLPLPRPAFRFSFSLPLGAPFSESAPLVTQVKQVLFAICRVCLFGLNSAPKTHPRLADQFSRRLFCRRV